MKTHRASRWLSVAILLAGIASSAPAATVVIYAATDLPIVQPLIADFENAHPDIKVDYREMHSTDLHNRFLDETATGNKADIVWSSAMDLQMKLVNDGHAKPHRSDETAALPRWARWRDEAFGTTFEPVGFAYNRDLLDAKDVPQTHAELARLLVSQPERFRNRLATYDPYQSGLGYLLHSQDLEANPVVFRDLIRVMGQVGLSVKPTTTEMLDSIVSGKALIGYNILCSYAIARANTDPRIGIVMPRDYTLVMSRIAFISRYAPHPEAAAVWLDYILSPRGQAMLNQSGLLSVRADVEGGGAAAALRTQLGNSFRPIVLSTGLLTYIDQFKRQLFLMHWDAAMKTDRDAPSVTPQIPAAPPRR